LLFYVKHVLQYVNGHADTGEMISGVSGILYR
jgi:hypothetical protein